MSETASVTETGATRHIDVIDAEGGTSGSFELPAHLFDVTANIPLIHQVVVAQLAAARQGTGRPAERLRAAAAAHLREHPTSADNGALVRTAIVGLTRLEDREATAAAATELGTRGIRVVAVAPGLVDREVLAQAWPEGVERYRRASALGRPVTAREVAETVAFLASPAASGITGTTVTIDAGWSATAGW